MFPKWFSTWNADNPVNIYKPAIIVGVAGGAVTVAALLVSFGQPWATKSQQTGPRGTGMHVVEFEVDIEAPDPDVAGFEVASIAASGEADPEDDMAADAGGDQDDVAGSDEVINSDSDDEDAEVAAEDNDINDEGDLASEDVAASDEEMGDTETAEAETSSDAGTGNAELDALIGADNGDLVAAMQQWTGIPDLFEDPDSYQTTVGLRMIQMTQNINGNWDDHVAANGEAGVTCYTCHRGNAVPEHVWFKSTPAVDSMAGWSANQNRATLVSQSTSLPSDALEEYFINYGIIAVHDLEARVDGVPGQDGYPGIQHAERTYSLMNYFANSLGANCTLCHNTRAFYDGGQVTPQWGTASLGIALVQELNNDYLLPLEEVLPPERLGVVHGDVPKLGCKTCHQGQQRPLKGLNVISDYPALSAEVE